MPKSPTLNRFPLFALFAHQAARHMGYPEDDARLLGYSTALLYAIYKAKVQARKAENEPTKKNELPKEIMEAKTKTLQFGGQDFQVIYGKAKRLKQTVVGHEVHDAEEYVGQIKAKFPEGWYDRLAKAFDKYLAVHNPEQLNKGSALFDLYKAWRDGCKVGFNRVDLEKLAAWLDERAR
ncbi:MAG: hypothetical protein ACLQNE_45435 [Thermoguttaceae bacterium]